VRAGVFRLESGTWTRFDSKVIPATEAATSLATDARGRIWIGYTHDRVLTVDEPPDGGGASRIHSITAKDGLQLGNILTITADGDDAWIGGENGMVRISDGRISPVIPDGSGFHSVSGIVKARNGDLWLNSNDGLIHLPVGEVKRFIENPNYRVQPEILNYLDGMPGVPSGLRNHPNIVEASDGRIWVGTTNGVAWTDPEHFHRNSLKPYVEIRAVTADGKRMDGTDAITFPKRTRNIQINYTTYSLTIPERVKFRYRLRGFDTDWQDPGTRRTAFYTDVPPGRYRFEVIASNNDGVWNTDGAASEFDLQPMFYQTKTFLILCVMAAAALIWLGVVVRIRQIKQQLRSRFEVRMAERTLIARDLHDTLLQTIQGSKLFVDQAVAEADSLTQLKTDVARLSEWLNRAISEGRTALNTLRSPLVEQVATTDLKPPAIITFGLPNNASPESIDPSPDGPPDNFPQDAAALEESLRALGDYLQRTHPTTYNLSCTGFRCDLNPLMVPELNRIGAEAVTNAFRHAQARTIRVELVFQRLCFQLKVIDDGKGFDPAAQSIASVGHWGLKGMGERASHIHGKLKVHSKPASGTLVELTVAAWWIYQGTRRLGL
jgi:signal transduction histidine kinase